MTSKTRRFRRRGPRPAQTVEPAKLLLRDRAYRELKDLIQSEAITAGAFLSERQLVERLGMSKTPIRVALQQLEADGLVTVSPQQGILVRELSAREISELFELRNAVEPFVVRRLTGRVKGQPVDRLKENMAAQRLAAARGDVVVLTELDVQFHVLLAELLDNRELLQPLRRAMTRLYREIVRISRRAEGRLQASVREHDAIVESVLGADAEGAAARMEEHLLFGRQFLLG
jgi:DNA-binding GntR family transcriptional regulator